MLLTDLPKNTTVLLNMFFLSIKDWHPSNLLTYVKLDYVGSRLLKGYHDEFIIYTAKKYVVFRYRSMTLRWRIYWNV